MMDLAWTAVVAGSLGFPLVESGQPRAAIVPSPANSPLRWSSNDAAAALGELLGGTEDRFARVMTLRARALGMTRSVHGVP